MTTRARIEFVGFWLLLFAAVIVFWLAVIVFWLAVIVFWLAVIEWLAGAVTV